MPNEENIPGGQESLILRHAEITNKVDALFKSMAADPQRQKEFIENPAKVMALEVEGMQLPTQQVSVTNALLFSVLSNQALMDWLGRYSLEHRRDPPTRDVFLRDFGDAVVEHGGAHFILSTLRNAALRGPVLGLGSPEFFFTSSSFLASGYVVKTDQRTALAQDLRSSQNFATSTQQTMPATASFDSAGVASEPISDAEGLENIGIFGSQYVRVTVEALVNYATMLKETGALSRMVSSIEGQMHE
jgi:hypothetical protein